MRTSGPLIVTHHAVERFIRRWCPGSSYGDARVCLERLATRAAPMRRKTRLGDAFVYTARTDAGEHVPLAVRDGVVVTVLDASHDEGSAPFGGIDPDDPLYLESEATRRECQAMLKAERAERTLAAARAGAKVGPAALERARAVLREQVKETPSPTPEAPSTKPPA
jgi:hypothetical protein